MSRPAERVETDRGRFFGAGRERRPSRTLVERGEPDAATARDDRPVAAFLATLEVPARRRGHGRRRPGPGRRPATGRGGHPQVSGSRRRAGRPRRDPAMVARPDGHASRSRPSDPEFDRYLDWLKYQALAERIWARRGFYQASGAFGFRDQLQDSVNLIWMDPALARRQILLHASQQFLEGDVVHWFHLLPGRPDRLRRRGRTPRTTSSGWPGPWSSTSRRPATNRSSTSGRPTSRRSSRSSPCRPASTAWGSTRSARPARTPSTGIA